jgi:hypothetical protein
MASRAALLFPSVYDASAPNVDLGRDAWDLGGQAVRGWLDFAILQFLFSDQISERTTHKRMMADFVGLAKPCFRQMTDWSYKRSELRLNLGLEFTWYDSEHRGEAKQHLEDIDLFPLFDAALRLAPSLLAESAIDSARMVGPRDRLPADACPGQLISI